MAATAPTATELAFPRTCIEAETAAWWWSPRSRAGQRRISARSSPRVGPSQAWALSKASANAKAWPTSCKADSCRRSCPRSRWSSCPRRRTLEMILGALSPSDTACRDLSNLTTCRSGRTAGPNGRSLRLSRWSRGHQMPSTRSTTRRPSRRGSSLAWHPDLQPRAKTLAIGPRRWATARPRATWSMTLRWTGQSSSDR